MTAEIAILNKSAVALAADSAVTIQTSDGGTKIYNSINKLFGLSRCHPIGIMIFGDAQVMDTPWETVIKIFRDELKYNGFDSLQEYGNRFIKFLSKRNLLFSQEKQKQYLILTILRFYSDLKRYILMESKQHLKDHKKLSSSELKKIIDIIINKFHHNLGTHKKLRGFPAGAGKSTLKKYRKHIAGAYSNVFQGLPISRASSNRIKQMTGMMFEKDIFPKGHYSGIVIAGFGQKQEFPSILAYEIGGIINNRLKYAKRVDVKINIRTTAAVHPFAQSDEVATFMDGINPNYRKEIRKYVYNLLTQYPEAIIDSLKNINAKQKDFMKKKTQKIANEEMKKFQQKIKIYEEEKHSDSIVQAVSFLPKEELAAMAEALVNLTSIKRRMSTDEETVGGLTDVAVISKGDGFIWIKRKQYFDPKLNPHFMAKYK